MWTIFKRPRVALQKTIITLKLPSTSSTQPIMISLAFVAALISGAAVASADGVPSVSLETGAACACTKLSAKYGNEILTSNSTNYTEEATAYWDIRSDLSPKCIFLPKDADEVADAIATVYSCGAQFAIRGGGHMNVGRLPLQPSPAQTNAGTT
jgi:hypothetical protein